MGIGTALLVGGALAAGAGTAVALSAKDPKSAGELEGKAAKEAEKKRLARAQSKDKSGKTVFTSPTGVAGMPLKKKLGE
jgi:hypothetical protein